MDGVGMRAEVYRNFPLSIGSTLLTASTSQLRSVPEGSQGKEDSTLRASEADSDQVARLAKAIIEEEVAKQDAEDAAEQLQLSHEQQGKKGEAESQREVKGAEPTEKVEMSQEKQSEKEIETK